MRALFTHRACVLALAAFTASLAHAENLNEIPADLKVPAAVREELAAGKRVEAVTKVWETTPVRHTLYLPKDWQPDRRFPVLVEFPGNGGYRNELGDVSDGTPHGCVLGYGLSGGSGFLWVCLPFLEITPAGKKQNCLTWWGDAEETERYCVATVRDVCERYGGDPSRVVLCGFSRGAIGCNYIGLRNDKIAGLWRAFFCHSHYDGVRRWDYPNSDAASAAERLTRLAGRPQWISHEQSVDATQRFLAESEAKGDFRLVAIPYPNHSAAWILRDLPQRRQARDWLAQVTAPTEVPKVRAPLSPAEPGPEPTLPQSPERK